MSISDATPEADDLSKILEAEDQLDIRLHRDRTFDAGTPEAEEELTHLAREYDDLATRAVEFSISDLLSTHPDWQGCQNQLRESAKRTDPDVMRLHAKRDLAIQLGVLTRVQRTAAAAGATPTPVERDTAAPAHARARLAALHAARGRDETSAAEFTRQVRVVAEELIKEHGPGAITVDLFASSREATSPAGADEIAMVEATREALTSAMGTLKHDPIDLAAGLQAVVEVAEALHRHHGSPASALCLAHAYELFGLLEKRIDVPVLRAQCRVALGKAHLIRVETGTVAPSLGR